jgi:voltage-gated sodium channel
MLTTFAVLKLFVGIIVDAMRSQALSDAHVEREAMLTETENVLGEVRSLRPEVAELRSELRKP